MLPRQPHSLDDGIARRNDDIVRKDRLVILDPSAGFDDHYEFIVGLESLIMLLFLCCLYCVECECIGGSLDATIYFCIVELI